MRFKENPRFILPAWSWDVAHLWRMSRGGMAGTGPLLETGGLMDQSVLMLRAFSCLNAAEAEFKKEIGEVFGEG
ncbi:MAG: hypothetical protein SFV21_00285 [Rhodospirillaceae bacterium]|nr:hypothetical protein [Rhodospirillaceae bacterium]